MLFCDFFLKGHEVWQGLKLGWDTFFQLLVILICFINTFLVCDHSFSLLETKTKIRGLQPKKYKFLQSAFALGNGSTGPHLCICSTAVMDTNITISVFLYGIPQLLLLLQCLDSAMDQTDDIWLLTSLL